MFPKPVSDLKPNTYAYEQTPLVKPTGFREYDARWLFGSEINLMGVEALGLGLGTLIHELGVKPEIGGAESRCEESAIGADDDAIPLGVEGQDVQGLGVASSFGASSFGERADPEAFPLPDRIVGETSMAAEEPALDVDYIA